jgi:hypothetical protein
VPTGIVLQPWLQYEAKFVCGTSPQNANNPPLIAKGRYYTQINVHNPSRYQTVAFRKKFAIALAFEKAGVVSPFFQAKLQADQALQVDCGDILTHLNMNMLTGYAEGYAIIETPMELDVVSLYTAGWGAANDVSSIHTERVQPRRMEACAPLTVDLTTGVAPWQVVAESQVSGPLPRAANAYGLWQAPASVIGGAATPNNNTVVPRTWDFQICFCLCSGAQPKLNLSNAWVDDQLDFELNGHAIGTLPLNPTAAQMNAISGSAGQWFQPGQNCLRVRLTNIWPAGAGFALIGSITGADAACPIAPLP